MKITLGLTVKSTKWEPYYELVFEEYNKAATVSSGAGFPCRSQCGVAE